MAADQWTPYPYDQQAFDYSPDALREHWAVLHEGDSEPLPDDDDLLEAWRAFHKGDFQRATELGERLGVAGAVVASKAQATQGHYIERDRERRRQLLSGAAERAASAMEEMPDWANAHYQHAFALGRYAQVLSITEALAQGLAGKVKRALERTLELEPEHADAHTATGTYHAEIIDKVGTLVGGLTYGADKNKAMEHYRRGLELAPHSASARMEYADGLMMIYGSRKTGEATRLYEEAAELKALDALLRLDIELAKEELA